MIMMMIIIIIITTIIIIIIITITTITVGVCGKGTTHLPMENSRALKLLLDKEA